MTRRDPSTTLRLLLALGLLGLAGCGRGTTTTAACPPAQTPPPGPEAIDQMMDRELSDALAGRGVHEPAERSAARRQVVVGCRRNVASTMPVRLSVADATARAMQACSRVIDRFNQAEVTDAAFAGSEPPDPLVLANNRSEFQARAAAIIRDQRAGRCEPAPAPAAGG